AETVLGTAGAGLELYKDVYKAYPILLPYYRYHFLTRSKPASHLAALAHIKMKDLRDGVPELLAKVLNHVATKLRRD
ncbi:hypothetical protein, partial [Azospirillum argentinense]